MFAYLQQNLSASNRFLYLFRKQINWLYIRETYLPVRNKYTQNTKPSNANWDAGMVHYLQKTNIAISNMHHYSNNHSCSTSKFWCTALELSQMTLNTYHVIPVETWLNNLWVITASQFHIPDAEIEAGTP